MVLKGQQSGFKNLIVLFTELLFFCKIPGWYNNNILFFDQQDCLKVTKKLAGFSFYLIPRILHFYFLFRYFALMH